MTNKTTDRDERKAEIKKQLARLMNELNKTESAESRQKAEPLIGKYFRLRNSFGSDSKGWWLYAKLLSYDDPGYFRIWQFETDEYGRFTAHFRERRHLNSFLNGREWASISERQFKAAWKQQTDALARKAEAA